jgi:hypothetical protein
MGVIYIKAAEKLLHTGYRAAYNGKTKKAPKGIKMPPNAL